VMQAARETEWLSREALRERWRSSHSSVRVRRKTRKGREEEGLG
jgi:hypothetical protein